MSLESDYRRLLRAYPAEWRARREDEVTATFLDAAGDRRTLTLADRWDVWRGAARHRAANGGRFFAGARAAADLALTFGAAIAAYYLAVMETTPRTGQWVNDAVPNATGGVDIVPVWQEPPPGFGPFLSYVSVVAAAWVLAALVPARWTRLAVLGVLTTTLVDLVLLAAGNEHAIGPEALGMLAIPALPALAAARRRSWARRLPPIAAMAVTGAMGLAHQGVLRPWPPAASDLDVGVLLQLLLIAAVALCVFAYQRVAAWPVLFLAPVFAHFEINVSPMLSSLMDFGPGAANLVVLGLILISVCAGAVLSAFLTRGGRPPQAS